MLYQPSNISTSESSQQVNITNECCLISMQDGMKNLMWYWPDLCYPYHLLHFSGEKSSWFQMISFRQVCVDNHRSPSYSMAAVRSFEELTSVWAVQKTLPSMPGNKNSWNAHFSQHLLPPPPKKKKSPLSYSSSCPGLELLSVNRMTASEKIKQTRK